MNKRMKNTALDTIMYLKRLFGLRYVSAIIATPLLYVKMRKSPLKYIDPKIMIPIISNDERNEVPVLPRGLRSITI